MNHWEKDIYDWCKGYDDDDIKVLTCLNLIIQSIYELEAYGWDCIFHRMNVMSEYQRLINIEFESLDLCDVATSLEAIRALLIGGKINYNFLGDHLAKAVTEYGYVVPEKQKYMQPTIEDESEETE